MEVVNSSGDLGEIPSKPAILFGEIDMSLLTFMGDHPVLTVVLAIIVYAVIVDTIRICKHSTKEKSNEKRRR